MNRIEKTLIIILALPVFVAALFVLFTLNGVTEGELLFYGIIGLAFIPLFLVGMFLLFLVSGWRKRIIYLFIGLLNIPLSFYAFSYLGDKSRELIISVDNQTSDEFEMIIVSEFEHETLGPIKIQENLATDYKVTMPWFNLDISATLNGQKFYLSSIIGQSRPADYLLINEAGIVMRCNKEFRNCIEIEIIEEPNPSP